MVVEISEEALINRFVRYAEIDTQSDPKNLKQTPSSNGQWDLAALLVEEARKIGLQAEVDRHCYVYIKLPSNIPGKIPVLGFSAHLDTSSEAPGSNVKPVEQVYNGGDLILPVGTIISASDLEGFENDIIVTSDGSTLLGADDKAGISIIMEGLNAIIKSSMPHGDIYALFEPDEEIGHMVAKLNRENFPVAVAYTFDGGGGKFIEDETFHAIEATVTISGVTAHPGMGGYHILVNAITLAGQYMGNLPNTQHPETSQKDEGFYYPFHIEGGAGKVKLGYLIRDFQEEDALKKVTVLSNIGSAFNRMYGKGTVTVRAKKQYQNMKAVLDQHPHVMEMALEAAKLAGVEPETMKIRGGTDGSALTVHHGIPTPNIFCGSHNYHSIKEFAVGREMLAAARTILFIVDRFTAYHQ